MHKITIISTCTHDWGGSEELWGKSVPILQNLGFEITVIKSKINFSHPEFVKLANTGVTLIETTPDLSTLEKIIKKSTSFAKRISIRLKLSAYVQNDYKSLKKALITQRPSLIIISQGLNFDGLKIAHQCLLLKIPYIIVAQNAVDFYWPYKTDRDFMLETLKKARKCFFVSQHNLRLTEEQFGARLPNSQVIFNPVKLAGKHIPYPTGSPVYKIACIARLFVMDKGQDILLRILAQQKWKDRPVKISFVGKGDDEEGLKAMASLLGVHNVEFTGQIADIESLWKEHHALILPSRSEGLPLAMVEAMSIGRPVIVSNAGGNAEILKEGINGFLGQSNEQSFGEAMERAWEQRDNWEQLGKNAAAYMKEIIPASPEREFAALVSDIAKN